MQCQRMHRRLGEQRARRLTQPSSTMNLKLSFEGRLIKDSRGIKSLFRGNGLWMSRGTWNIGSKEGGEKRTPGGEARKGRQKFELNPESHGETLGKRHTFWSARKPLLGDRCEGWREMEAGRTAKRLLQSAVCFGPLHSVIRE